MRWKNSSVRRMRYFIFFLMLPHMQPDSVNYLWPIVELLFNAGRIISALVIICLLIYKRRIPSLPVYILAAIHGLILFSTYINGVDIWGPTVTTISSLVAVCLIDIFADQIAILIRSLMLNLEWLIYGNFVSILLYYPYGMYTRSNHSGACYFLGYHNGFFQYVLLAVLVSALYAHIEKKKVRSLCLVAAGYLCVVITWSATSLTALALVAVLMLFPLQRLKRWMTFSCVFAAAMTGNAAVSIFRVIENVPWIGRLVKKLLKKDITLTGRTYFWNQFYKKFLAHPFLGYGAREHLKLPYGGRGFYGAHNQYFELLLEGGMFALALFLFFNLLMGKALDQCKDDAIRYIFLSVLTGLYIIFIAEAYLSPLVYMIMILAYHANKFAAVPGPTTRRLRFVIRRGNHVTNRKFDQEH